MTGRAFCLLVTLFATACGDSGPPTPSPPGTGGETITGRERLGWDQPASSPAELATFRYAVYVDGARSEVADTACASTAGAGGFACSGRLPPMAPGAHTLELAAFYESGGVIESAKSAPLQVTVTGATSPVASTPQLQPGEVVATSDGARLTADLLVSGLEDVVDFAVGPEGRLFIAERAGRVRIVDGSTVADALQATADGGLLSLTLDPGFTRTGHLVTVHTAGGRFRLIRYRVLDGRLIDRMALIRDVPASPDPSAAVRFGPDGKLYAAFDDGGSPDAAAKLSEWHGKILRLNPDGRTPDDQPAASPVFWSGLRSPRGLDWTSHGNTLWMVEAGRDGLERIRGLVSAPGRPRRAGQRASYVLPQPLGAHALAFYRGDEVRPFAGDLFIAASEARYLLRVRFDPEDPLRVLSSERLLEDRIGEVRAVVTAGGALYVASDSGVWRLAKAEGTEGTGRD